MKIIHLIGKYREAKETISQWAKEGAEVVRPQVAIRRALTCQKCPLNVKKDFISRISAAYVRFKIEHAAKILLHVPNVKNLGRCSACFCSTDLKVFLPLKNIKPSQQDKHMFDPNCWLLTEQQNESNPH